MNNNLFANASMKILSGTHNECSQVYVGVIKRILAIQKILTICGISFARSTNISKEVS